MKSLPVLRSFLEAVAYRFIELIYRRHMSRVFGLQTPDFIGVGGVFEDLERRDGGSPSIEVIALSIVFSISYEQQ